MLLGNAAAQHPQAAQLLALAQLDRRADRRHASATSSEAANTVGAQLAGALPQRTAA